MSEGEHRYRAFISYSQRDKRFAARLHKALEAYRIPKGIEAPGIDPKTRKLGRLFRDDEELGASANLGAALEGALDDAENLIVICSPNAVKSRWVNEEIKRFKSRSNVKVLGVIVGGEPNSEDTTKECFPSALKVKIGPDRAETTEPDEPRAPALRSAGFNRIVAELVAGMIGLPFDRLWRRDQRRRRGRRIIAVVTSALLVISASVLSIWQIDELRKREANGWMLRAERLVGDGQEVGPVTTELAMKFAMIAAKLHPASTGERFAKVSQYNRTIALMRIPEGSISAASTSPDGTRVLAVSDRYVYVLDSFTGDLLLRLEQADRINVASFSPDGERLITVSDDQTAAIWSSNGELLLRLEGHTDVVSDGVFDSTGTRVATSSFDGTAKVWSAETGVVISQVRADDVIYETKFSPDSKFIATISADGTASLWDPLHGMQLVKAAGHTGGVTQMAISPDSRFFATGGDDGQVYVWDVVTGGVVEQIDELGRVSGLSFSPDGADLIIASSIEAIENEGAPRGLNMSSGRTFGGPRRRSENVLSAVFSPNGKSVLTSSDDGYARIWNVSESEPLTPKLVHSADISAASFSPDGSRVLTASVDGSLRYWNVSSQQKNERLARAEIAVELACRFVLRGSLRYIERGDINATGGKDGPLGDRLGDDVCAANNMFEDMWRQFTNLVGFPFNRVQSTGRLG